MEELSQKEKISVALAASVIMLSAISIGVFVYTGGSALFYLTAAVAVVLGFYITYLISKREESQRGKKK